MNIIEKGIKDMKILSAPPGTCLECAVAHEANQPHDKQSLHYQYTFYQKHDRWPSWRDAMAHCSDETKTIWSEELAALGIDIYEE